MTQHPKPQASALDFESERRRETTAWERADGLGVDIVETTGESDGTFVVQLPDGSPHECYVVQDGGQYRGFCSCKGYRHHFADTSEACAHLCALRKRDVLHDTVPDVDDLEDDDGEDVQEDGDETDAEDDVEESPIVDSRRLSEGEA